MNLIIYEDDRDFANLMNRHISLHTQFPIVINTDDNKEVEHYINNNTEVSLYFLDIMIKDCDDGFTIAEKIVNKNNGDLIVFMTSNSEKIITNPFHKTIAFNVLFKSSETLMSEIIDTIMLAEKALANSCLLYSAGKTENFYIPFDSILYIEYIKSSLKMVVNCTNAQFTIRGTLTNLHKKLDDRFARCHNSYIVNIDKIVKINKKTRLIHLSDNSTCPFSQLKKQNLQRALEKRVPESKRSD